MLSKMIKAAMAGGAMLAASFAVSTASAADLSPRPYYKGMPRSVVGYYNWTGFYAGVFGGYGWGTSDWSSPAVSTDPSGALFGATLGYNWQSGSLVYGLEADMGWSMIKGDVACGIGRCETENKWLGTGRVRLGYALDRFLPYVTGGVAFGNVEATNTATGLSGASDTMFGWTAGAGLEYAFMGNWTAKLEYLYVDLGDFSCGAACSAVVPSNVDFSASILKVGLNYKFSGPIFSRF